MCAPDCAPPSNPERPQAPAAAPVATLKDSALATRLVVEASTTVGPDSREDWSLRIDRDGPGLVYKRDPDGVYRQWLLNVSAEQGRSIVRAVQAADFFTLPEALGPKLLRGGAGNKRLHIKLGEQSRKIYLFEPRFATGPEVARFQLVWDAIKAVAPVPPPS